MSAFVIPELHRCRILGVPPVHGLRLRLYELAHGLAEQHGSVKICLRPTKAIVELCRDHGIPTSFAEAERAIQDLSDLGYVGRAEMIVFEEGLPLRGLVFPELSETNLSWPEELNDPDWSWINQLRIVHTHVDFSTEVVRRVA